MEAVFHYVLEGMMLLAAVQAWRAFRALKADVQAAKLAAERSKATPEAMIFRPGGKRA